ncbi:MULTISPECIES: UPF0223 family protein [Enterococcus]|uniref:UPF0223 protein KUA55_06285 n=1 Tax=Enterococcus alishanensis TaxID=1303817 RepID=A0ABS6TBK9_9ENTE|nr:UPF0223 family protein [Enterococcus alishanensis]MBV7390283.1 UPF0223 family protein [Enterococcus alishanensis]
MDNYSYPLDDDWSTEEMVTVVQFLNLVEKAYEEGIQTDTFLAGYKDFKTVVKSIGEEKRIGRSFEQTSGYSLYQSVKTAKNTQQKRFKM